MLSSQLKATLIGLIAPMCWGMSVGLVRRMAESFGLAGGLTLLYAVSSIFLFCLLRCPHFALFPKKYLFLGIPLATLSCSCFCISLYLSDGGQQTVEVGMVNYLWPCLVVVFSIIINHVKARWWVLPGIIISFTGIVMVLSGERGIDLQLIWNHICTNPLSYLLAFAGAVTWAIYSNLTRAWSNGQNPSLIVFVLNFIVFSSLWSMGYGSITSGTSAGWASLVIGAIAMGGASAAWSHGMMHGNITILAVASYFTPVLSCLFASVWIGANLDVSFYKGIFVLVIGSLLCWSSTQFTRK